MNRKMHITELCVTAMCIALGCIMPLAFHAFDAGRMFLPMHLPVLVCGLLAGPLWGMLCGVCTPLLSCLMTGMPAPVGLISMVPELLVYGILTGLLFRVIRTGRRIADIYFSLLGAMVAGRIVAGVAEALFYLAGSRGRTITSWALARFVTGLPGIVCQLLLIPAVVLLCERIGVLPSRYPKQKKEKRSCKNESLQHPSFQSESNGNKQMAANTRESQKIMSKREWRE